MLPSLKRLHHARSKIAGSPLSGNIPVAKFILYQEEKGGTSMFPASTWPRIPTLTDVWSLRFERLAQNFSSYHETERMPMCLREKACTSWSVISMYQVLLFQKYHLSLGLHACGTSLNCSPMWRTQPPWSLYSKALLKHTWQRRGKVCTRL